VGEGTITGFELDGTMKVFRDFEVSANVTRTTGTNTVSDEPFPYIPPTFGALKLRNFPATRHALWGEAVFSFAGAQNRISSAELANPILANGTPAYQVFSVRAGANVLANVNVDVAVENVFDEAYRSTARSCTNRVVSSSYRRSIASKERRQ
jgi:outer membrane receptor protein involved in Fe transport